MITSNIFSIPFLLCSLPMLMPLFTFADIPECIRVYFSYTPWADILQSSGFILRTHYFAVFFFDLYRYLEHFTHYRHQLCIISISNILIHLTQSFSVDYLLFPLICLPSVCPERVKLSLLFLLSMCTRKKCIWHILISTISVSFLFIFERTRSSHFPQIIFIIFFSWTT